MRSENGIWAGVGLLERLRLSREIERDIEKGDSGSVKGYLVAIDRFEYLSLKNSKKSFDERKVRIVMKATVPLLAMSAECPARIAIWANNGWKPIATMSLAKLHHVSDSSSGEDQEAAFDKLFWLGFSVVRDT